MSEETYPDVIELKLKLRFPKLINSTKLCNTLQSQ